MNLLHEWVQTLYEISISILMYNSISFHEAELTYTRAKILKKSLDIGVWYENFSSSTVAEHLRAALS